MKLRIDFVTNSSSSSYCMYGIYVEGLDDLGLSKEKIKEIDHSGDGLYPFFGEQGVDNFEYHCPYGEGYAIGRSWADIRDDETGKQFKDYVEEMIKKMFPSYTGNCSTMEEEWYNG